MIFQELLKINENHDYKLAYKFSENHLLVKGQGRMNVRLAVQLFSNSVSKAIAYCGEQQFIKNYNWKDVK